MKRVMCVVLASVFILPVAVFAQGSHLDIRRTDREVALLKGAVKSVETDTTVNVSGKHRKELEVYDEVGNLLFDTDWDNEGEMVDTITNFYDESGCFYRQLYIDFENDLTNDWSVILNPNTKQIAMKNQNNGDVIVRTYSPEKKLLHYRLLDKKKKLKSASRNKWNEKGQRAQYIKCDDRNKPLYTYYFKWKENGLIDKERQHYFQEKKERLHTYEYMLMDAEGNWTQRLMVRYDIGGKKRENVYEKTTVRTIEYFENKPTSSEELSGETGDAAEMSVEDSLSTNCPLENSSLSTNALSGNKNEF